VSARTVVDLAGRRWEIALVDGRQVWTDRGSGERRLDGPDGETVED
jgi:hypothetical protein